MKVKGTVEIKFNIPGYPQYCEKSQSNDCKFLYRAGTLSCCTLLAKRLREEEVDYGMGEMTPTTKRSKKCKRLFKNPKES
jgi:hypothetical protein